ncbi:MAG TPA: group 1 truncated hemoglobin [Terriglobia bacterium]|nr:group 1 truncated hemoglobin [Terriglobia bacterium]
MTSLNSQPEETLYRRLGGYDVIAAVIDEFLGRFRSDPRFARFGGGRSLDSQQRARQLLVGQICSLAGGPCVYIGRDMKTAHAGLGITGAEWQANMEHASAALEKHGVVLREKEEFLAIFEKYKDDIVEKS